MEHKEVLPLVSVIVLNHNGEVFLKKCLESIFKNDYPNFEVIVVDNASIDSSIEMIKSNFLKVKIIQNKIGLGFSGGFNEGIEHAKGEFVLLLSNDTWIEKKFISKIAKFYLTHNYSAISPREASYTGKKNSFYVTKIDLLGHNVFLSTTNSKLNSFYLTGVSLFFNKRFYQKTGGMDEDFFLYCEDVDWFWRLQLLGEKFSYADVYINHFGAGSSGGTGKKIKSTIFYYRNRNTLQMLIKNYSLPFLIFLLPIYVLQNILEFIFFVFLLKFDVAFTYVTSYYYVLMHFNHIIKKRRIVQKRRVIGDLEIAKNMYLGFGKLYHLKQFYAKK